MSERFKYVKYDERSIIQQEAFKEQFEKLETMVEDLSQGRAKSLMLTHLEEAYMWLGKAIRDEQLSRGSQTEHVPERTNV